MMKNAKRNIGMLTVFAAMIVGIAASRTNAQGVITVAARKAEMAKVANWAGEWKGSGWIQKGPARETFEGTEIIQSKLDGLALLVEGKFLDPKGVPVHQTLAVLSTNEANNGYDFATYLANGMSGVQKFAVVGDHFEWGFDIPKLGSIRYTIAIDGNKWHEVGEFKRLGTSDWIKNFEMTLTRSK
jgi:hypothetical protein